MHFKHDIAAVRFQHVPEIAVQSCEVVNPDMNTI
jgi:hypothetical protein